MRYLATYTSDTGEEFWLTSKDPWNASTVRHYAKWLSEEEKKQHILHNQKSWRPNPWKYIPWNPQGPWKMFASPDLAHVFPMKLQLGLCGCKDPISVTLHEGGDFVGWISAGDTDPQPTMIFKHMELLNVCFPYGLKYAVRQGAGYIIHLRIECE